MKATLKIVTADKQFTQDQIAIMKRVLNVLAEHNLSANLTMKQKVKVNPHLKIAQ